MSENALSALHFIPFFPIFFIGLWCLVGLILSHTGGWHRLAARFATQERPTGQKHSMQSGQIGWVNYNNCLTLYTSEKGLHLAVLFLFRLGHPPLMIPWEEIHKVHTHRFLWGQSIGFSVGESEAVNIRLSHRLLPCFPQELRSACDDAAGAFPS